MAKVFSGGVSRGGGGEARQVRAGRGCGLWGGGHRGSGGGGAEAAPDREVEGRGLVAEVGLGASGRGLPGDWAAPREERILQALGAKRAELGGIPGLGSERTDPGEVRQALPASRVVLLGWAKAGWRRCSEILQVLAVMGAELPS